MIARTFLCAVLACLPAAPGLAEEGFFTGEKPPAVRAAWPSVYAFVCEGRKSAYVASAFLVATRKRGTMTDAYFVTAGHAVAECKQPRRYLAENLERPRFEADGITVARVPRRLERVATVAVDDAYDLAVVKAETSAGLRLGAPLVADDACAEARDREVYAIGFPGVGKRPSLRLNRQEKRWSRGAAVGLGRAEFRGVEAIYIATTLDSLPGSSGGPVLDARGALIGVVAQGAAGADNKYRYEVDAKNPRDWQTFLAPCRAVLRLLGRATVK